MRLRKLVPSVLSLMGCIHHEANAFTVRELIAAGSQPPRARRHPRWMRNGDVEELVEVQPPNVQA